jgi:uncharacterized protein (DUF58 family)
VPAPPPRAAARTRRRGPVQRVRAWFVGRLPHSDTQVLGQGNIYILPTTAGWVFAATLLVLLVASINYQLNLGYVLTFLLAGSGLVSMHATHGTLRGLTLHLRPPAPSFAAAAASLEVVLTNPGAIRHGIGLRLEGAPDATAHVTFVPAHRGRHPVPVLRAETRFPLGLFRAWTVWRPASTLLAWPAPEDGAPPLPAALAAAGGIAQARTSSGGEVEGVRAYRRGDPLRLVAWKKAAQTLETGAGLVSRDTSAPARREVVLDWGATASGAARRDGAWGAEERLSRLAAWVLAAHRAGVAYRLALPGRDVAMADGDAHRRQALDALALWSAGRSA